MVEAFSKNLEVRGGNAVSVDEKHYKSKGRARWMARAMCMATRLIPASDHRPDKLNCDAARFLERVVGRLGGSPLLLFSDRLRGRRKGYKNIMRNNPSPPPRTYPMRPSTTSIQTTTGTSATTRTPRGARRILRGFNSDVPGLFVPDEIRHNFLRQHTGLGGPTPAEKAGIAIPGPYKLRAMIRCAAASRFSFA